MNISTSIDIQAPRDTVWRIITDIDHCVNTIQAIEEIEILERPAAGLKGLKWRETRTMFGKQATEVMTITEVDEGVSYQTYAENHGMIYVSRLELEEVDGGTRLTMSFHGEAASFGAKIMSAIMGVFFKGATLKALDADLQDIKRAAETPGQP